MALIFERKDKDGKITGYRVQIRMKGAKTQVATFELKTKAKEWIQDIESSIRDGRHFKTTEAKKHTLADLIDRYIRDVIPQEEERTETKNAVGVVERTNWLYPTFKHHACIDCRAER